MLDKVIFRDKRVVGTKDAVKLVLSFDLDANTSISKAFAYLKARKKGLGKKKTTLIIIAHGISSAATYKLFTKTYKRWEFSGTIELGKENLTVQNVILWGAIRNLADHIILYVCKAAQTPVGKQGSLSDGWVLMKLLAAHTNANVYASDTNQTYTPIGLKLARWKGNVFKFSPNGKVSTVPGFYAKYISGQL